MAQSNLREDRLADDVLHFHSYQVCLQLEQVRGMVAGVFQH